MNKWTLKPGCWPRPPVNYCILIALALKSSHTGSLKVQQIYHFTREHFPFFQTAPDGWKNTIRHNLCFNNSFRKTCNQLCGDGKRKSCFWHLTLDGQRRLRDEIRTLTGESFKQLERSMSHPVKWLLVKHAREQIVDFKCACESNDCSFIENLVSSAHYVDLATIYKASDLSNMYMTTYAAWVNLHNPNADSDDSSKSDWVWAGQFENKLDDNWANDEPDAGETWKWSTGLSDYADEGWHQDIAGNCATISSVGKLMVPKNCEDRFPFVCYRDNLVLIKENKTWEEALEYCMTIGYRLVSVQPGADHDYMMNIIEYEGST
ncbi:Forkhead box protein N5, partial [Nibea albiflora]